MPARGVRKGAKRGHLYKKVKKTQRQRGASESRAEEIAARTVNKERARSGESLVRAFEESREGQVVGAARRSAVQDQPVQGPDPASSSTTRPGSSGSRVGLR